MVSIHTHCFSFPMIPHKTPKFKVPLVHRASRFPKVHGCVHMHMCLCLKVHACMCVCACMLKCPWVQQESSVSVLQEWEVHVYVQWWEGMRCGCNSPCACRWVRTPCVGVCQCRWVCAGARGHDELGPACKAFKLDQLPGAGKVCW